MRIKLNFSITMPKKFATENSKSVAAKDRKKQTKEKTNSNSQKEIEDAYWKDDNKQLQKKQKKKEVEEKKKQEALQRKTEAKAILEKEMNEIPKKPSKPAQKVTRAKISDIVAASSKQEKEEKHIETYLDAPVFENTNRLEIEVEEARTVDDAISILNSNQDDIDKHPEKRMKAAYKAYQQRRLHELKSENTGLRLSQLKQIISKEWEKSPENPLNQ